MPKYREPLWLELVVNNFLNSITALFHRSFRNTPLEYWLLHPEGQIGTLFMTVILVALVWMIWLEYSTQRAKARTATSVPTHIHHTSIVHKHTHIHNRAYRASSASDFWNVELNETPLLRYLGSSSPSHRPTTRPFGTPTPSNRTLTSSELETPRGLRPSHSQNYSSLAKEAPVSYDTLQETGMLSSDGSPTRKWVLTKRMIAAGDRAEEKKTEGKGKGVVAYWENDVGRKGGRAKLRQELDGEDGFF